MKINPKKWFVIRPKIVVKVKLRGNNVCKCKLASVKLELKRQA